MASTSLHERAGVSFRMSRKRDRELWEAIEQDREDGETRTERTRALLGLGLAAERALAQYSISVSEDDVENGQVVTDKEAFIEVAIGREIDRYGAGNIRMQLGDDPNPILSP